MFKSNFDISDILNIDKYRLIVGNKVFFTVPDIKVSIEDGGENTKWSITPKIGDTLESTYSEFIRGFIFSYDNNFIRGMLEEHSLEKDLSNELLSITGNKDSYNLLMGRLKEFNSDTSELNKLMQSLYKFVSHKNNLLLDLSDVKIKKEESKITMIFSSDEDIEPEKHNFKYTLGKTTGTLNWTDTASRKVVSAEEDISLYIAKVNFKKIEQELKDLFLLEDLVIDQPDLGDVANQLSDMNRLVQSFLTIESSPSDIKSATAFRYSYDNGVSLTISEDEDLFIGRQFGNIILINNKTKSQTQINIKDENKWNLLNRPEIKDPITSIFNLFSMITLKRTGDRYSNDKKVNLFMKLLFIIKHYKDLWIIDHGENKKQITLRDTYALSFEYINDRSFKVIYKTEGKDDYSGVPFSLILTYDGMLKLEFKKENESLEVTYINLNSLTKFYKYMTQTDLINDLEEFRRNLNVLVKYK